MLAGVTLKDVAQTLDVSQMTISRWERGEAEPRLTQRTAYARLLREIQAAATEPTP